MESIILSYKELIPFHIIFNLIIENIINEK